MHTLLLILHISGAIALGGVVVASFMSIFANTQDRYKGFVYTLGAGLLVQAISGSLLELTSAHPALFLSFCSKIFFYLTVVGVTQGILFIKMSKIQMKIPYLYASYCGAFTVIAAMVTGLLMK